MPMQSQKGGSIKQTTTTTIIELQPQPQPSSNHNHNHHHLECGMLNYDPKQDNGPGAQRTGWGMD